MLAEQIHDPEKIMPLVLHRLDAIENNQQEIKKMVSEIPSIERVLTLENEVAALKVVYNTLENDFITLQTEVKTSVKWLYVLGGVATAIFGAIQAITALTGALGG